MQKKLRRSCEFVGKPIVLALIGDAEEEATKWIEQHMTNPVVGFISGKTAPSGKIMVMESCGIRVASSPSLIGSTLVEELLEKGLWGKEIIPKTM